MVMRIAALSAMFILIGFLIFTSIGGEANILGETNPFNGTIGGDWTSDGTYYNTETNNNGDVHIADLSTNQTIYNTSSSASGVYRTNRIAKMTSVNLVDLTVQMDRLGTADSKATAYIYYTDGNQTLDTVEVPLENGLVTYQSVATDKTAATVFYIDFLLETNTTATSDNPALQSVSYEGTIFEPVLPPRAVDLFQVAMLLLVIGMAIAIAAAKLG